MAFPWIFMRTMFKVNLVMAIVAVVFGTTSIIYNATEVNIMWLAKLAFTASTLSLASTIAKISYKGSIVGKQGWWPLKYEVVDLIFSVMLVVITGLYVFTGKRVDAIFKIINVLLNGFVLAIRLMELDERVIVIHPNGEEEEMLVTAQSGNVLTLMSMPGKKKPLPQGVRRQCEANVAGGQEKKTME